MNMINLQGRSPTWCPGCGNFGIWAALKNTIIKLGWGVDQFVIVYGIGCSGNMTDFIKSHGFHSLHGRAIPNAIGIKLANHKLKVICVVGDGDCYGEGGNHILHAARGNHDIKVLVHDNRVYGLTTGQTAPTSPKGFKSKSTPEGVIEEPLNGLGLAVMQGASFVARGYAGDVPHLSNIFEQALNHTGFTLIDVLQPCVTFNKNCSYPFYQQNTLKIDAAHDITNKIKAFEYTNMINNKIPIGVIYQEKKLAYYEELSQLKNSTLVTQPILSSNLSQLWQKLA